MWTYTKLHLFTIKKITKINTIISNYLIYEFVSAWISNQTLHGYLANSRYIYWIKCGYKYWHSCNWTVIVQLDWLFKAIRIISFHVYPVCLIDKVMFCKSWHFEYDNNKAGREVQDKHDNLISMLNTNLAQVNTYPLQTCRQKHVKTMCNVRQALLVHSEVEEW